MGCILFLTQDSQLRAKVLDILTTKNRHDLLCFSRIRDALKVLDMRRSS